MTDRKVANAMWFIICQKLVTGFYCIGSDKQ